MKGGKGRMGSEGGKLIMILHNLLTSLFFWVHGRCVSIHTVLYRHYPKCAQTFWAGGGFVKLQTQLSL